MCTALNTITCRLAGEPFIIFKLPKQVRYIISTLNHRNEKGQQSLRSLSLLPLAFPRSPPQHGFLEKLSACINIIYLFTDVYKVGAVHTDQPNGSVKPSATVYSTMFTLGEHANLVILSVLMCKLSLRASFSAAFCFFCQFTFLLYANFFS